MSNAKHLAPILLVAAFTFVTVPTAFGARSILEQPDLQNTASKVVVTKKVNGNHSHHRRKSGKRSKRVPRAVSLSKESW